MPTTTGASPLLRAALLYAARGWPVLPVHAAKGGLCSCRLADCGSRGKHPRTTHGLQDATTDSDRIRDWWGMWPDANLGLPTGLASSTWVLDMDPRHGGTDSLAALEREHGPFPETVEALTGGGGRHLFFRWMPSGPRNSAGRVGAGLDVRGEGGYVVLPPSNHLSGQRYEWEASSHPNDLAVARAPAWLVELATAKSSAVLQQAAPLPDRIPEGQRNKVLASLAGYMRRRGMGAGAIAAALLVENADRCTPPLTEAEVTRIATSVSRYDPAGPSDDRRGRARRGKRALPSIVVSS